AHLYQQPHLYARPAPGQISPPTSSPALRAHTAALLPPPDMLELLAYLHDPELVARFQRRCGLFLVEDARRGSGRTRAPARDQVHAETPLSQLKGRWEHQDRNSNFEYKQNGCADGGCSRPRYEVRNWLLHFLFLISAGLGHEVFYITCLPCIHWNLDPFLCRRLVNMWTVVMYIGQVMKDLLKLPRPLSPPVVKLETRVNAEYGLPSTHAMAATSISFTVLLSAPSRIQFQFEVGLLIAVTLSSLVCLSRLYTGMHSVLDVICGALISTILMFLTYPYWETFDHFQLTSRISPFVALSLPLFLSYTYPELDHYSTTRGDTTTILGAGAGCSVGYWVNEQLGQTFEPQGALPVPLPALTGKRPGTRRRTLPCRSRGACWDSAGSENTEPAGAVLMEIQSFQMEDLSFGYYVTWMLE
ncbi:hypothetical protein L3Q82_019020, partial [Scortum barcoo]